MLMEIDRYQLAVPDASAVVERWQRLLGAEIQSTDRLSLLGAKRTSMRIATGIVEVLEPDGNGVIADAIKRRKGAHLFSAGASCADLTQMTGHLESNNYPYTQEGKQLFVVGEEIGIPGLRLVLSTQEARTKVGNLDFLYEATILAQHPTELTTRFAQVFALDAQEFVSIDSPRFGYDGTLTLFRENLLHRFEVIAPLDKDKTMGRFFSKVGACLYMGFAETADIWKIEQTLKESGEGYTVDRPADRSDALPADQLWLHPATLGGMMLGLSRPTMAWRWSGHPERVRPL